MKITIAHYNLLLINGLLFVAAISLLVSNVLKAIPMHAIEPFSFTEISSIENFDLLPPQFLEASDGISLAYYSFLNTSNKEIIILYHGAGLYGNKTYQWVAKTLNEKYGIGCYVFDIRGHGNSNGPRGDAPSINRVLLDVWQAVNLVKKEHPHSKIYVTGHSSGAGLIINYAANFSNKIEDGYIFLAPFLGPKSNTARTHQSKSTNFIKHARPWVYILGALFPNSFFSRCKAVFFNYPKNIIDFDEKILTSYTYNMSCATTPYEINSLLRKIDKPVGLFIGKNDEQFAPEKVIDYTKLIQTPVEKEIIEGATHLSILLETPALIARYLKKINEPV